MDIFVYCLIICVLFVLASIFDVLKNCLKEPRQIREMLRTSQLVELQKVMDEAEVNHEKTAE